MSVFDQDDQPRHVGALVQQVERIMSRNREGTETIRALWTSGDVELPCHMACDGYIVVEHEGAVLRAMCPVFMEEPHCPLTQKSAKEFAARMTRAGFGPRYQDVDPERIRCREPVETYIRDMETNLKEGRGLILTGDVGVGKTMVLAYIAKHMLLANVGVVCFKVASLIDDLIERSTRKATVSRALQAQVLMLDDWGSGEMPTWVLGMIEGVIEQRYANKMPTLVSTNMTKEQLVEKVEFRRMVDRWRETNTLIVIGGTSQRHD